MTGRALTDYARAGSAVEAVWVTAQQRGLAVQPISPVFLYAHDHEDLEKLSPAHAQALQRLQDRVPRTHSYRARRVTCAGAQIRRRARHVGTESA